MAYSRSLCVSSGSCVCMYFVLSCYVHRDAAQCCHGDEVGQGGEEGDTGFRRLNGVN